jgi:hypothetical protein
MPTILLKGNIGGSVARPTTLEIREPAYASGGFSDMPLHIVGTNDLAIRAGADVVPLVSPRRQIEVVGDQDVGGRKTFGLLNISITGGNPDEVLTTNGLGVMRWAPAAAPGTSYTFGRGLSEDQGTVTLNVAGTGPGLGTIGGAWISRGLSILAATGELSLDIATNAALGGVIPTIGLSVSGTGILTLNQAGQSSGELGGVYVPPGTAPAGGLTVSDAALTLLPATAAQLGGVYVPQTVTGGLNLSAQGALSLRNADEANRGGVHVPGSDAARNSGPGLRIGPVLGALSLFVAGTAATELGGIFVPPLAAPGNGLTLAMGTGALSLAQATAAALGGVYVPANSGLTVSAAALAVDPATYAEAESGVNAIKPITSAVLRLGPVTPAGGHPSLPTTNKTLLGSITELFNLIQAATGQLTIVGTFNADASTSTSVDDEVTPTTGSPLQAGPLPAANQARPGYFLIVDTAGTPEDPSNAPQVPMVLNDMIICVEDAGFPGTNHWSHVGIGQAQILASTVVVTPIAGLPGVTNVQAALEALEARRVLVDDFSITGNGGEDPLEVDIVDGGTF